MKKPFFSIIIPVYNSADTVIETLGSVLAQTFKDYEIIVINDGSTDQSKVIIEDYFRKNSQLRNIFIDQLQNRGVAYARNIGIQRASAEYIAFLDADDIWYSDKLQRVFSVLNDEPTVDLVCHDEFMKLNNKVIARLSCCPNPKATKKIYDYLLLKRNCIFTSSVVVNKLKIIEAGLFSENFTAGSDYECWLRLALKGKFFFLNAPLGEYRIRNLTIQSDVDNAVASIISIVDIHYRNYYKKNDIISKLYKRFRKANIIFEGALHAYYRCLWLKSLKYCVKSLLMNPFLFKSYFCALRNCFNLIIKQ